MCGPVGVLEEDPHGHCAFGQGVQSGAAIHETFPSCEMVSENQFFDVEEGFVVSIYFESFNDRVFACAKRGGRVLPL